MVDTSDKKGGLPLFMPAPRPAPRLDTASAARLTEATADLGFSRPLSGSEAKPQETPQTAGAPPEGERERRPAAAREARPGPTARAPRVKTKTAEAPTGVAAPNDVAAAGAPRHRDADDPFGKAQPLRLDVPQDLWTDLKIAAAKRRVTVRWLVLEALEKAGYDVEVASIPEDGRRVRSG